MSWVPTALSAGDAMMDKSDKLLAFMGKRETDNKHLESFNPLPFTGKRDLNSHSLM